MIKQHILLAVCGGIAAYKSAEIVRLLVKKGHAVKVIMTDSAMEFIRPLTFQALSGNPVQTQLLDTEQDNAMGHINLARWADKIIIAPATANIIAKLAHGLADDLVSTLCLAAECPIYIAPSMNQAMWHKPITQTNINALQQQGMQLIFPEQGEQACGEVGWGRLAEPLIICQSVIEDDISTVNNSLKGVRLLISAGPTREPLDPVRYLTNRSSGKMGYALAEAGLWAGASVSLVSGVVNLTAPSEVNLTVVETADEMFQAVMSKATSHDIYIGSAAVADYTPVQMSSQKIKKQKQEMILSLQKTKDILAEVALLAKRPFVVGFAAETDHLETYARDKLQCKNLDMIAANWVGREQGGFENNENALQVFWHNGHKNFPLINKKHLAKQLIALIAEIRNENNTIKNT
ncbi:MAG: bifunctional phosphopantothenoylcysteine decarboxylase/phosphopantothenate--cysteine ligase CoaBC [Methylococcales bacterium]|nr:bifunctional phosphopantothenoylcysteine decarboxylase/phosphopantothenate--cysteine ligase CoaBC [Methylococcales bacterium]